jgi:hypothetical protein
VRFFVRHHLMRIELRKTDIKLFLFKQEKKDGMIPGFLKD